MNYRQRETSREIRLWIKDIIVPVIIGGAIIASNPEAKNWVSNKWALMKSKFKKGS